MAQKKTTKNSIRSEDTKPQKLKCGLVMPIAGFDAYTAEHWLEVKEIIIESIKSIEGYDFDVKLVSDADDISIIQKRIVQSLYDSDIIVCDVSGKNPNVMFELGMRLAFDKSVVILKDDETSYSFDTGIIEHITYPKDLRYSQIVKFKALISTKVRATYEKSKNSDYSAFLDSFGKFTVAKIDESEVSGDEAILELLSDIKGRLPAKQSMNFFTPYRELDDRELPITRSTRLIKRIVKGWMLQNKSENPMSLIGDQELYDYVSSQFDAPAHFTTRREFESFVDQILLTIS